MALDNDNASTSRLMQRVVSKDNVLAALKRVERNKGAAGPDGMGVGELRAYLRKEWLAIRSALLNGTYKPQAVRRVEIPKPEGGVRLLGIPNALDRFIQQALLQVLTPVFDPHFSEQSYGFRPKRSAHDAVRKAHEYIKAGYRVVVDIDLSKFFDGVNHDKLMARVARRLEDKVVLKLIRRYLRSGVMVNGVAVATPQGTPQGGPLSPLLANIMLDDLDHLLEGRGLKFCRYADDCNIYVRSQRAGERVMAAVRRFVENRLSLRVNEEKSAVGKPQSRKFLGYSFFHRPTGVRIRIAPKSTERFKARIREITDPSRGVGIEQRIAELNVFMRGWYHYFKLARTHATYEWLDGWTRRRLKLCRWKDWRNIGTAQSTGFDQGS